MAEINIHNIKGVVITKWEEKTLGDGNHKYKVKKVFITTDTGEEHTINLFA